MSNGKNPDPNLRSNPFQGHHIPDTIREYKLKRVKD